MTKNLPANLMQSLISSAGKKLTAKTGATQTHANNYIDRTTKVLLICDGSGSMAESAGDRAKFEHLQDAVDDVCKRMTADVIAFDSTARLLGRGPVTIPRPSGSTNLSGALQLAADQSPRRTIVISDGYPDCAESAISAAKKLSGSIDVIYIGPDDDTDAKGFMARLAKAGRGQVVTCDLVRLRSGQPLIAATKQLLIGGGN